MRIDIRPIQVVTLRKQTHRVATIFRRLRAFRQSNRELKLKALAEKENRRRSPVKTKRRWW